MHKLKVAVIGAGNIARTVHLPALAGMENVDIVGICDKNEAAMAQCVQAFPIQDSFLGARELFRKTQPEAVIVCVPNALHREMTLAALQAGCHVLCEKPPAMNLREAKEMHEAAQERGKVLCYNFCHRYRGEMESIAQLLQGGALGQVYAGRVQATRRRAVPGWGVFLDKDMQGGGALIDIGVHMLDAVLYLLGYPRPRYAAAGSYDRIGKQGGESLFGPWKGDAFTVEDALFGFILFENGMSLQLETAFALHNAQTETTAMNFSLYGERAGVTLAPCMLHTSEGAQQVDRNIPFVPGDFARAATMDFVESIRKGTRPKGASETALLVQEVMDGLYRSAETGKPYLFSES